MEKPPVVPTNAELYKELEKLQGKVQTLEYDIKCLKAEQESLRRKMYNRP